MRLHVTHDDKFIDYFIDNAASLGFRNDKYFIYNESRELKHVTSSPVNVAPLYSKDFYKIIGDISCYDSVFIHFLSPSLFDFVLSIPNQVKLAWIFWGGDAFEHPRIRNNYFKPLTGDYHNRELNTNIRAYKLRLTQLLNRLSRRHDESLDEKWERCMSRFDYFCHYIHDDWLCLKNTFRLKAEYVEFNYTSWNQITRGRHDTINSDDNCNILVGNSADISNNHIDIMSALSKTNISANQKIYVPLSYASPSEIYNKHIIELGYKLFGNNFIPLNTFISKQEYNKIIKSCGFCIMDHIRSQALGNILSALANGTKIFMSEKSNLYRLLISQGFIVYTTEHNLQTPLSLSNRLGNEQNMINLVNLDKYYGSDSILGRYRKVLEISR